MVQQKQQQKISRTNDFVNNVKLGEFSYTFVSFDNYNVDYYSANYTMLTNILGDYYPNAQVYLLDCTYVSKFGFGSVNTNGNALPEFSFANSETARLYNTHCLHTSKLCITDKLKDTHLMSDVIHPKAIMMKKIANQCYHEMMADNCLE